MKEIRMITINKIKTCLLRIFEAEDDSEPDCNIIRANNAAITRVLKPFKIEYDELMCLYSLCFENAGYIVKCRFCFNDRELFKNLKLGKYYTLKELGLDD